MAVTTGSAEGVADGSGSAEGEPEGVGSSLAQALRLRISAAASSPDSIRFFIENSFPVLVIKRLISLVQLLDGSNAHSPPI